MHDTPLILGRPCCWIAALLLALAAGQAHAEGCAMPEWDGHLPVQAPTLEAGATWTYSRGEAESVRRMRLIRVTDSQAIYALNGNRSYVENWMTSADMNPQRDGEKVLLSFPLRIGKSWTDSYAEPGEIHTPSGDYLYTYNETATSTVIGVEDIAVGAGRFRTVRLDRVSHWSKNHLQLILDRHNGDSPPSGLQVEGLTHTRLWYAPRVGRVVRQVVLPMTDDHKGGADAALMDDPGARISELVAYQTEDVDCPLGPAVDAHMPPDSADSGAVGDLTQRLTRALALQPHQPLRSSPDREPAP